LKLLVDTHVLLWWLTEDDKLSGTGKSIIAAPQNTLFMSAATVLELRIKEAIGKIALPQNFADALADEPFEPLAVTVAHAHAVAALPLHHRDPFDRMLIAQARVDGLKIMTHDAVFREYDVDCLIV